MRSFHFNELITPYCILKTVGIFCNTVSAHSHVSPCRKTLLTCASSGDLYFLLKICHSGTNYNLFNKNRVKKTKKIKNQACYKTSVSEFVLKSIIAINLRS